LPLPPAPEFGKNGFQKDVSAWLKEGLPLFEKYMFEAINPEGKYPGVVIAAPKNDVNDYFFYWVRDGSLTLE
jgi:hypothetical protein